MFLVDRSAGKYPGGLFNKVVDFLISRMSGVGVARVVYIGSSDQTVTAPRDDKNNPVINHLSGFIGPGTRRIDKTRGHKRSSLFSEIVPIGDAIAGRFFINLGDLVVVKAFGSRLFGGQNIF